MAARFFGNLDHGGVPFVTVDTDQGTGTCYSYVAGSLMTVCNSLSGPTFRGLWTTELVLRSDLEVSLNVCEVEVYSVDDDAVPDFRAYNDATTPGMWVYGLWCPVHHVVEPVRAVLSGLLPCVFARRPGTSARTLLTCACGVVVGRGQGAVATLVCGLVRCGLLGRCAC